MPITFKFNNEDTYYIIKYIGQLTDEDLINYWKKIFDHPDFSFELDELTDLSEIDASKLTAIGMREFAKYTNTFRREKQSKPRKIAVYAPNNLPFGLSRIYEGHTDETIDNMEVFKSIEKAMKFLASSE